ncbi:hypothetical protein HDU93_001936 [Gonapodya sp. JEL0774]|nr:hypothetical protein HDU93_001936 [Gonapodya sp. JEL0774]
MPSKKRQADSDGEDADRVDLSRSEPQSLLDNKKRKFFEGANTESGSGSSGGPSRSHFGRKDTKPNKGSIVWVKVAPYPWWPGVILEKGTLHEDHTSGWTVERFGITDPTTVRVQNFGFRHGLVNFDYDYDGMLDGGIHSGVSNSFTRALDLAILARTKLAELTGGDDENHLDDVDQRIAPKKMTRPQLGVKSGKSDYQMDKLSLSTTKRPDKVTQAPRRTKAKEKDASPSFDARSSKAPSASPENTPESSTRKPVSSLQCSTSLLPTKPSGPHVSKFILTVEHQGEIVTNERTIQRENGTTSLTQRLVIKGEAKANEHTLDGQVQYLSVHSRPVSGNAPVEAQHDSSSCECGVSEMAKSGLELGIEESGKSYVTETRPIYVSERQAIAEVQGSRYNSPLPTPDGDGETDDEDLFPSPEDMLKSPSKFTEIPKPRDKLLKKKTKTVPSKKHDRSSVTDEVDDDDDDSDEGDATLRLPTQAVLAYASEDHAYHPARVTEYHAKRRNYNVVYWNGSQRRLDRKKFFCKWEPGFKDCKLTTDLPVDLTDPDFVDESFQDPGLSKMIQSFDNELLDVLLGKVQSRRMELFRARKNSRLTWIYGTGPLDSRQIHVVSSLLSDMLRTWSTRPSPHAHDLAWISNYDHHLLIHSVLLCEAVIRLIQVTEQVVRSEAEGKLQLGYMCGWARELVFLKQGTQVISSTGLSEGGWDVSGSSGRVGGGSGSSGKDNMVNELMDGVLEASARGRVRLVKNLKE